MVATNLIGRKVSYYTGSVTIPATIVVVYPQAHHAAPPLVTLEVAITGQLIVTHIDKVWTIDEREFDRLKEEAVQRSTQPKPIDPRTTAKF